MANEEEILEAVDRYLEDDNRYAILLHGEWGCGKSRFVDTSLRTHLVDDDWSLVHVSLFGVGSREELYSRILGARASLLVGHGSQGASKESNPLLRSIGGALGEVLESKTGVSISLTAGLAVSLAGWDNILLVLDDLERRDKSFTNALFGIANDLVENKGAKVMFVCNVARDEIDEEQIEKLIWYRMCYAPTTDELIKDILGEVLEGYPLEINALGLMRSASVYSRCCNARAFLKTRNLVKLILESGYPDATYIDASRRRKVIRDVFRYALCGALGIEPSVDPVRPAGLVEIDDLLGDNIHDEETKEVALRWKVRLSERQSYRELGILEDYFERGTLDITQAYYSLEGYTENHYPDSDVRAAAQWANAKVRTHLLDDKEAQKALDDIVSGLSMGDVPIGSVPSLLESVERLAHYGIAHEIDEELALEGAMDLATANPNEAVETLESILPMAKTEPIFPWQRAPHLVSDYLAFLRELDLSNRWNKIDEAVECGDSNAATIAGKQIIKVIEGNTYGCKDALMPVELTCRAVSVSDVEGLNELRQAIDRLAREFSTYLAGQAMFVDWLTDLKAGLETTEVQTTMRDYLRQLMIRDIDLALNDVVLG